jgi:hypothetical protein
MGKIGRQKGPHNVLWQFNTAARRNTMSPKTTTSKQGGGKKQENHISHARIIKPGTSREKTHGEKSQKLTYRSTPTQWSTPHHPLTTSHRDVLSYAWAYHAYPSKDQWPLTKLVIQSRNVPHKASTATYQLKQYCPAFHLGQALQIEERAWSVEKVGHDEASGVY